MGLDIYFTTNKYVGMPFHDKHDVDAMNLPRTIERRYFGNEDINWHRVTEIVEQVGTLCGTWHILEFLDKHIERNKCEPAYFDGCKILELIDTVDRAVKLGTIEDLIPLPMGWTLGEYHESIRQLEKILSDLAKEDSDCYIRASY